MLSVLRGPLLGLNRTRILSRRMYATVTSIDSKNNQKTDLKSHERDDDLKLKARGPLVKNFFVGKVDKELLGYPEVINREDMNELNESLQHIRNFFLSETYMEKSELERLDGINALGLYGLNVPIEYDGKGYKWTECLYATEPEMNDTKFAFGILSHRVVVDLLNQFGSNEQKNKYLPKLAKGTLVASEAVFEDNNSEGGILSSIAQFDHDNNFWLLNGEKINVVRGSIPLKSEHLFLVTAKIPSTQLNSSNNMSIFLVESNQPGIKSSLLNDHSSSSLNIQKIKFENVKIGDDCRIGNPNESNMIAEFLFKSNRLRFSMLCLGLAKRILNNISIHCISHRYSGVALKDMHLPKMRLANAFCSIYAMESMIYLTSGLMDEFENQDVSLESAITKYFSLINLRNIVMDPMDYIGSKWLTTCDSGNIMFDSAIQLYTHTETIDSLRMYIGLNGLQHAGAILHHIVNKLRNPLFNPGYIFSKLFNQSSMDNPKTKMKLEENVHPTLAPAAQYIEHSVVRLHNCTELLLTRFGNDIVEHHRDLQRLSDMCTLIYAMFASASRASRSYCIGLPNADIELLTASTICTNGHNEIKIICNEILNGHYVNNDNNLLRLGKKVGQHREYFPESPLSYNF